MSAQRRWTSWLIVAVLFLVILTHYGIWTETIDINSITQSAASHFTDYRAKANTNPPQVALDSVPEPTTPTPALTPETPACPQQSTCPEPSKPAFLDMPNDYALSSAEDLMCEKFFTEKYVQTIATHPTSLCSNNGSAVTEFEVPTHPAHRKLAPATQVFLFQGVHWDPNTRAFVARSDDRTASPAIYGQTPLGSLRYDKAAPGCRSASERQLIIYPALWEGTFPNIWHRLLELWQAKLSFDAVRIALDPDSGSPYITKSQATQAKVVFPDDIPGPWTDLWEIVTGSPAQSPSTLSTDTCYDVIIPTVGWASPFWSALLTSKYESCPRQTLMTSFVNNIMKFYKVTPKQPAEISARQHPTITIVQRGHSRKFQDFDSLLEKLHQRHPESAINVVDLELLSKREQIGLAAETDVWVAHHGAGMMYQMFMQRNAAVVEIVPPIFVSRGFRWIARMRGLVHFIGKAMWKAEYEEKYKGVPKPADWKPERQGDSDANNWQFEEWIWITHDEILDLVDAAVLSQKHRSNDLS
ncbi:hypothetical protein N0V93_001987 [Gnomoniopsis smithogilvyi]|uniref:Glycosyltransferase 61 catalytic domain-containing protein n=1 Tax=Gnomoniopsis smithogilvyi TaxID=1191159 RepID=A0A9W8Z2P0_9PEZI|nr:hypothetical protein N0V93_001987 [Gnomoniopsis smithogilvyi]